MSGATSADGLEALPDLFKTYKPQILIVALGSNDGMLGNPVRLLQENLTKIIKMARTEKTKVLLIGFQLPSNYGKNYTAQFAKIYTDLSKQYKVPLVPFMLNGLATDLSFFQDDKLHPTEAAQSKILDNIWPYLQPIIK